MSDLDRALGDITKIRRQVARTTEFRGYGPATLASTGLLAMAAAVVQSRWAPAPGAHIAVYLGIWLTTAVLSAALIGAQMLTRSRRMHSGMADEMIRLAVEQFLPAAGAGALITLVLTRSAPAAEWMLPGLWQVIFSLGIFSSIRFLPRAVAIAGVWYLFTGLTSLALGDARALSPWGMGAAFGVGQMLVAAVLLRHAREEASDEG